MKSPQEYDSQYRQEKGINPSDDIYDFTLKYAEYYHKEKMSKRKANLEDRKEKFVNSFLELFPWENRGGKPWRIEFIEYWTEHGENDRLMRFEKEKSFSIKRRVRTWIENSKKYGQSSKKQSASDILMSRINH